jgi:hypothetical protein
MDDSDPMIARLLILNEFSLPTALWLMARREKVYILRVAPHLRLLAAPMKRLGDFLIRRGWAEMPDDIDRRMVRRDGLLGDNGFNHIVEEIETELLGVLLPAGNATGRLRDYDYAMKKAIEVVALQVVADVYCILQWLRRHGTRPYIIYGTSPITDMIYQLYYKETSPFKCGVPKFARVLINSINAVTSLASAAVWLVRRVKSSVPVRRYKLGLDVNGYTEAMVLDRVMDDPSQALVVYRGPDYKDYYGALYAKYPCCYPDSCAVGVGRLPGLIMLAIRDLAALVVRHGAGDCAVFMGYCGLVSSKIRLEAFHANIHFDYFWGRDDYNPHHIIRSQIMRRSGGKTIGINHGLPLTIITPEWRQIDYDLYYSFGTHLYDNYYKSAWPAHMRVESVGNIHFTPEHRLRLDAPRPRDFAYFVTAHPLLDRILDEVFVVARHFPDRKVYIKMKAGRCAQDMAVYEEKMAVAPANVVRVAETQSPYEMMFDICYSITSSSTLGAEALQFRVISFIFDLLPDIRFLYADFPKLIVASGQDIVRRVEDIESGAEIYRFEDFTALINVSAPCIYERIRSDLGLPPGVPAIPAEG